MSTNYSRASNVNHQCGAFSSLHVQRAIRYPAHRKIRGCELWCCALGTYRISTNNINKWCQHYSAYQGNWVSVYAFALASQASSQNLKRLGSNPEVIIIRKNLPERKPNPNKVRLAAHGFLPSCRTALWQRASRSIGNLGLGLGSGRVRVRVQGPEASCRTQGRPMLSH